MKTYDLLTAEHDELNKQWEHTMYAHEQGWLTWTGYLHYKLPIKEKIKKILDRYEQRQIKKWKREKDQQGEQAQIEL